MDLFVTTAVKLRVLLTVGIICLPRAASGDALYPPAMDVDRESDDYSAATEEYLRALDLDGESVQFERLGGTTATNWAVSSEGHVVADLKCSSGNTNHRGAVITYRLGQALGFRVYPIAVYRDIDQQVGDLRISEQCALKEWVTVFTQYYWTRETFTTTKSRDKRRLAAALRCEEPKPQSSESFRFYAYSSYGNPAITDNERTRYVGVTNLAQAAQDFSNMMVVDTLIGNEDRFPGGNLFFRSESKAYETSDGAIIFDRARLFSLDNEAAFKSARAASTYAARDFVALVTRFDTDLIDRVRALSEDDEALAAITDGDEQLTDFIREGAAIVLKHHAEAVARCGQAMAHF